VTQVETASAQARETRHAQDNRHHRIEDRLVNQWKGEYLEVAAPDRLVLT